MVSAIIPKWMHLNRDIRYIDIHGFSMHRHQIPTQQQHLFISDSPIFSSGFSEVENVI